MQPVSGGQPLVIGTVGTTVFDRPVNLLNVVIPGTYVGTVKLSNVSAAAGTTASNLVLTFGLPTTTVPQNIYTGINFSKGLVVEATGTPALVLSLD